MKSEVKDWMLTNQYGPYEKGYLFATMENNNLKQKFKFKQINKYFQQ